MILYCSIMPYGSTLLTPPLTPPPQVDEVRGIMTENIEKVLSRGEALQDISERSEVLMQNSTLFRTNSTRLRRHLCCQSYRRWACCIAVLVAVLLLVVVVAVIAALATTGKFKNN